MRYAHGGISGVHRLVSRIGRAERFNAFIFCIVFDAHFLVFFFNDPAPTEIYPLSLHDALPIFAEGGEAALAALDDEPADVIVADMRMPVMDGATLLTHVRDRHPTTIRMVLSGYATPQHLTSAATVAHRLLGKPVNTDELGRLIERSCALRELTQQAKGYRMTAGATALPAQPGVYAQLTQTLADPTWQP